MTDFEMQQIVSAIYAASACQSKGDGSVDDFLARYDEMLDRFSDRAGQIIEEAMNA